jgi:transcriptional regulator with XRE-family HTH domain
MKKKRFKNKRSRLCEFLKEARIKSGLSQIEVSKPLGYSSAQFISNWERSLCPPPAASMPEICKILKVDRAVAMNLMIEEATESIRELFGVK